MDTPLDELLPDVIGRLQEALGTALLGAVVLVALWLGWSGLRFAFNAMLRRAGH